MYGFISLIARIDDHPGLEGAGAAWRVAATDFRRELARGPALRSILNRYTHVSMAQLVASAACLPFHQIGPRLAHWLLMRQDRAHADSFKVTPELLAYKLGVRRVGITLAAGDLQRSRLIEYSRGNLKVLERPGLEAMACACYAADCRSYNGLLRRAPRQPPGVIPAGPGGG